MRPRKSTILTKFQNAFSFPFLDDTVKNSKLPLSRLAILAILLGLIYLFIQRFHIEENLQLLKLMGVVIPGSIFYNLLALRFRLAFFFVLNVVVLIILFGLGNGLYILCAGLLLVGVASWAMPLLYKTGLILVLGATLVLLRLGSELETVATVIGALFMFRILLYTYEQAHIKEAVNIWQRIGYFFLLPNLVFFIFPVVDYKTFIRQYYARPAIEIYLKGIRWMALGLLHLFLYRIIYYYLLPAPSDLNNIYLLLQFMVASYALIIRLSGIFHFCVGVLCLFGFNLPPTFNNYFLASSFSDLWRRINIYWRDFVMKVFYFPILFKFKKRNSTAIFASVLIVFAVNWFLHAYQWFWIRGSFPVKLTDILFWSIFGVLVAFNSVYQKNNSGKRKQEFTFLTTGIYMLKIMGMFAFMCVLWTFWTSESPAHFGALLKQVEAPGARDAVVLLGSIFGIWTIGSAILYLLEKYRFRFNVSALKPAVQVSLLVIPLGLALLVSRPSLKDMLENYTAADLKPVFQTQLNKYDQEKLYKGYYETLIEDTNISSTLSEVLATKPDNWSKLNETGAVVPVNGWLEKRLKPNFTFEFKGAKLMTNEYGMRDGPYPKEKCPRCLRVAMLGASIEMGSGVENEYTFENVLEGLLNRQQPWPEYRKIEILNFAISGTHLPNYVATAVERIPAFHPDVLIYTAHPNEAYRAMKKFVSIILAGSIQQYPEASSIISKVGITTDMPVPEIERRLKDVQMQLLDWGLREIASSCKKNKIFPVWAFIPSLLDKPIPDESKELSAMAANAGFATIDLHDLYDNYSPDDLMIAPWDRHPNIRGHEMIADALYKGLVEDIHLDSLLQNNAQ